MASSSAPRRCRASVAFGSEAEVLPAGSATIHTTPFPADTQHAPTAGLCRPHRPTRHPPRGGDSRWRARVWLTFLGRVGMSAAPAMTRQTRGSGAPISSGPEPMGSSKMRSQTLALGRRPGVSARTPPLPLRTSVGRLVASSARPLHSGGAGVLISGDAVGGGCASAGRAVGSVRCAIGRRVP
jgi:hypothetical protein